MIEYIKSIFREGDSIRIAGREGQFEGEIKHIGKDFIALKYPNGATQGIHLSAIQTFATTDAPLPKFNTHVVQYLDAEMPTNEQPSDNGEEKKSQESEKSFKQFKPGDRIPLSELEQRDPNLAKQWKTGEQKKKYREVAPEVIKQLKNTLAKIKEEKRSEDLDILKAQGTIVDIQPSFNFAFIDDSSDGARCFFNRSDIVDSRLHDESGSDIPVLFFRSRNLKGNAAKSVHRVMSVIDLLELSVHLYDTGDTYRAMQVLYNAQKQCDNQSIADILSVMNEGKVSDKNNRETHDSRRDTVIDKANEAKLAKDYDQAIDLYKDALDRGINTELCIKEILQIYSSIHNQETDDAKRQSIKDEASDFIQKYKRELPQNISATSVLENVYFALGMYDDHIDVVEELITQFGRSGDLPKYVFYLNKAAMSYLYLNDLEQSMDACKQGLEVEPGNPHLLKTLQTIMEQPGYSE